MCGRVAICRPSQSTSLCTFVLYGVFLVFSCTFVFPPHVLLPPPRVSTIPTPNTPKHHPHVCPPSPPQTPPNTPKHTKTPPPQVYWNPGNSAAFLSLVEQLTGKPLDGSTWVEELATPVDDKVCEGEAWENKGVWRKRGGGRRRGELWWWFGGKRQHALCVACSAHTYSPPTHVLSLYPLRWRRSMQPMKEALQQVPPSLLGMMWTCRCGCGLWMATLSSLIPTWTLASRYVGGCVFVRMCVLESVVGTHSGHHQAITRTQGACNKFKQWVHDKYFAVATA